MSHLIQHMNCLSIAADLDRIHKIQVQGQKWLEGTMLSWQPKMMKKMLSVMLLSNLIILHFLWMWSGIWFVATASVCIWTWIWPMRHCRLVQEMAFWFQCWKTQLVSFDQSTNSGAIDEKMDGFALEGKPSF